MNVLTALLILAASAAAAASPRYTEVALACDSGCESADSLQVVDALRVGLSHAGVAVVQSRSAKDNLPLLVNGRITIQGDTVRVAAELLEVDRSLSRYTVLATHKDLTTQVQRMGERFGRAVSRY